MSHTTSDAIEHLQTLQRALERLDDHIAHIEQRAKSNGTTFPINFPSHPADNSALHVDIQTLLELLRGERATHAQAVTEQATEVARLTGVLNDVAPRLPFGDDAPF